ncbi:MAG: hypothetical protein EA393_01165 [Bacteroidetes bacterium]|nr:MAG: hypothetical protein EA393_01165 [Bacteroidota bacterium]
MEKIVPVSYYGSDKPLPEVLQLRAGHLSMLYENGALRYIKADDKEIVRMIHPAVRDHNWETASPEIISEQMNIGEDHFEILLTCRYIHGRIDFTATYTITGNPDGRVVFRMKGEALSSFSKNRIGLCVLHPLKECVDKECHVTDHSGETKLTRFPWHISPYQPMKNIASMRWQLSDNCRAQLNFSGDVFEMEDHRNWTDASFKTYSTPLEIPFPVLVEKGKKMEQQVELLVDYCHSSDLKTGSKKQATIDFKHPGLPFPKIGVSRTIEGSLTKEQQFLIRELNLDHYRADIQLYNLGWNKEFNDTVEEVKSLNLPLELVVHVSKDFKHELLDLARIIKESNPRISHIILFHKDHKTTPGDVSVFARELLSSVDPGLKIGGGTNVYFAELNRERPNPSTLDFVCYSVNPQVHAVDNRSIVETPEAQAWTVQSAKEYFNGIPVFVTPVTLKPRFNANATSDESVTSPGQIPEKYDVRQMSLFGATWTLGCIKALAEAGASSFTLFETVGLGGLMDSHQVDPYRHIFRTEKNSLYPVYHILKQVLELKNRHFIPAISPEPLKWNLLVMQINNRTKIIVFNFTDKLVKLQIPIPEGRLYSKYGLDRIFNDINSTHYSNETCISINTRKKIDLEIEPFEGLVINFA